MQVRHDEGVAVRIVPEPCAVVREDYGEASAGACTGQPLSHEMFIQFRVPMPLLWQKATRAGASSQVPSRSGGVRDPGMHVRSLHGNRESFCLATDAVSGGPRIGKARSHSR